MEKKCENCAFKCDTENICINSNSKFYFRNQYPKEGFCELYKERSGKTVSQTTSNELKELLQGFASLMDCVWGNNNGTKGLESFLNSDIGAIEDGKD